MKESERIKVKGLRFKVYDLGTRVIGIRRTVLGIRCRSPEYGSCKRPKTYDLSLSFNPVPYTLYLDTDFYPVMSS